ncbi:MAG: metallophosphoesterase, partial [Ornithinibacter sp.]
MRSPRTVAVTLLAVASLLVAACTNSPDAGNQGAVPTPPPVPASPSAVPSPGATAPPSPTGGTASVRFSALGDINSTDASDAVLRSIGERHDDFTLALGDLSYGDDGAEDAWCRFVTTRVGADHPFELVSGNHESNGENGNIERFARCLPNRLPRLVGTYGRQWYVDQPASHPLVRVVMISPALDFGHGEWSYATGTPHSDWLRAAVTGARAAGIPWVVVGMHKPCLSVGNYECDPGADVVDLLLDTGVDLVLTGHEHLYQRTRPLGLGAACRTMRPGRFDPGGVATRGGTTFVTVGTGGTPLRDVHEADSERRYFAGLSGADLDPSYGSLDVRVT